MRAIVSNFSIEFVKESRRLGYIGPGSGRYWLFVAVVWLAFFCGVVIESSFAQKHFSLMVFDWEQMS